MVMAILLPACGQSAPSSGEASPSAGETVTIAFGGDVNLGRRQNAISARDGHAHALEGVPALREADLAIVNLESVVSGIGTGGVEKGESGPFYFRGRPEMLNVLLAAGIDAVGTANNHSGDYGPDALVDQARLLDAAGIAHAGSGQDMHAACAPTMLAAGDLVVGLVSVDATMPHFAATDDAPGTCHLDLADSNAWRLRIGPALEEARRVAQVAVVAVHWGPNLATEPSEEKRAIGRLLVELGADAVLGSSAHVLQGIEVHDGRPILHDAGNLLFDSQEGAVDSALFLLDVNANGVVGVRVEPLLSDYGVTAVAPAAGRDRILGDLASMSAALGTTLQGNGIAFDPPAREPPVAPAAVPERQPVATEPADEPPPGCVVDEMPAGLAGEPQDLGPLTFLGARLEPQPVDGDRYASVESYWRVDAPVTEDLWLSPRLDSTGGGDTWRGDHEPCDWAWPTSRLQPGVIYRDWVTLRPRDDPGPELVLRVGVTDGEDTIELSGELGRLPVADD